MYSPDLKFIAVPILEIIGGTQKIWTVPGYVQALFFPKLLTGFHSELPYKYIPNLKSVALPVPDIRGGS